MCHSCGGVQSYAELKGGVKRCPKESCGGALYRPKMIWAEVQSSFLGRWEDFNKRRDESLRKLDAGGYLGRADTSIAPLDVHACHG